MLPIVGAGIYEGARLYNSTAGPYQTKRGRNYSLRKTSYKRARSNSFHAKVLKELPAKHYSGNPIASLTHNTVLTLIPTAGLVQGTGNANRVADQIQLLAFKIRGSIQTPTAANGYSYRVLVGWTGEEFNLPTNFGSGLGTNEIFLPSTTPNWVAGGIVNPKAFTVLYDQVFDVNSQVSGANDVLSFAETVSIDTKFQYQESNSSYGKTRNLAVVVIGSVVAGVSGTTAAGAVVVAYDLIFK